MNAISLMHQIKHNHLHSMVTAPLANLLPPSASGVSPIISEIAIFLCTGHIATIFD
jgi:hypothetical protein